MSKEEWRPYYRTIGYDSRGPLIGRPAPYCHHSEGGNPRARGNEGRLKTMFKTGSLTSLGKRIVEACPPINSASIDESTLIGKLNGLNAYADFRQDIASLVEAGYLIQDPSTGKYNRVN